MNSLALFFHVLVDDMTIINATAHVRVGNEEGLTFSMTLSPLPLIRYFYLSILFVLLWFDITISDISVI